MVSTKKVTPPTPPTPSAPVEPVTPSDLNSEDHIAYVMGYEDGTVRPNGNITRAEAMAIINRVMNRGVDNKSKLMGVKYFPDNQPGAWYYYEVIEAANQHDHSSKRPSEDWTGELLGYPYDIAKYERP